MISLAGKNALVTGGARGIGAACARILARAGANVGIAYRSRDTEAQAVLDDCLAMGRSAFAFKGDLATREGHDTFVHEAVVRFGGVDIFVGNSGIWPPTPVDVGELDDARWRHTMQTNLDGMFYGARAAIRQMPHGGRLIFISSTAGQRGEAGHADYAASKGAMISFVKSLAVELGPRDITVNSVAPGWVDTEAVERPFADDGRARIERAIPLGRVAAPEDIAGPVLFLASSLARHVTGEILNVNGGSVLCG
ncbi:MAG: SDR family NAD(P)-dependent oxidoreductase [Gemmatimonas sp.]|jgi:3-oxoacyl-[acyl-carrier protein] reductase|uniref:SDR family NAD(P)-dependent oxidoreductase n=1 Tax=Gemmatimonas sp. TaxID=1962908 RepID=UPI00391F659B|nr:SDR family oxidoreductase [Gemmatimonadota bacterium]